MVSVQESGNTLLGHVRVQKLFTSVRSLIQKLFGSKKAAAVEIATPVSDTKAQGNVTVSTVGNSSNNTASIRISDDLDSISYSNMSADMRALKDDYEIAYKTYVTAITTGDANKAQEALKAFNTAKSAYEQALRSIK